MRERTELLIGKTGLEKLKSSVVAVVGVGGVGGYVAEQLARVGVGKIVLIDNDIVSESNKNRQIIALDSTIGKLKVEAMKQRIFDIDSKISVLALPVRLTQQNASELIGDVNYIVDAIDSVPDKVALIKLAKQKNINIISSMGSGNRFCMCNFEIAKIKNTTYDKLAKKMRILLKDEGIDDVDVCYTKAPCVKCEGVIGSISYVPAMCGITIASFVVNELLK
ncbi:MAG: ThiF family adenylyltransferase [Clostridia bacterium]